MKKYSFIYGTIILVLVNFLVRSLGFVYKIILSRLIGPEAIGLYQMVFPFLMLIITITSAGIPLAVSRLIAKENSLNNRLGVYKVLTVALFIGGVFAFVVTVIVSLNLDFVVTKVLKNKDIYYPVLFSIPAVCLITFSGILRGFFYGLKDMKPPASAQIVEQLFRILFVISYLIYKRPYSPIVAATIAIIGISIGEFFGLLYLVLRFNLRKLGSTRSILKTYSDSSIKVAGSILYISVPIAISRLVSTLLQTANSILIPQRLVLAGYTSSQAIQTFGKITGMAMPLLFLPFTVTSALSTNIVPNISEQMATNRMNDIDKQCNLAIKVTLIVAIPITLVYIIFGGRLAQLIYNEADVGRYLSIISYCTVFICMQHTLSSILHGMGKQIIATINLLLGMSIQLYCTYFLISNPKYGINGFFIGYVLCAFIVFALDFIVLKRSVKIKLSISQILVKPIICSIMMILAMIYSFDYLLVITSSNPLSLLFTMLLGMVIYVLLLSITKTLNIKSIIKEIKG